MHPQLTPRCHQWQGRGGSDSDEVSRAVDAICGWLERFDVLVVGPGLGRDPWVQETVTQVCSNAARVVRSPGLRSQNRALSLTRAPQTGRRSSLQAHHAEGRSRRLWLRLDACSGPAERCTAAVRAERLCQASPTV